MKPIIHITCLAIVLTFTAACDRQQAPKTSSVTSSDGTSITYDVAGRGEPAIVFVHCWTCNRTFWNAQFEYFAPEHTVVRLDLAGHGASGKDRPKHTLKRFSEDVIAVVNDLDLKRILLVGHSMGGPVSVETAVQLSDRIVGVVAVDSFYTPFPIPKTDEEAAAFIKPFEDEFVATNSKMVGSMFIAGADPVEKEKITASFGRADETMAVQALKDVVRWFRFDADERLAALGGRLRNINAAIPADQKPAREGIILISGVGHFIPQMKPVEFNQALEKVIIELTGS